MDARESATRDLERIRSIMERSGRYSHISGYSAMLAGILAVGGTVACRLDSIHFNNAEFAPDLKVIWGTVLLLALAQVLAYIIIHARHRAESAWSHLTRQIVVSMLPALFVGAAITGYSLQTGQLDLLPPMWMLAYGSCLVGLGLYAGRPMTVAGVLFLLVGAATLWWWKLYGLHAMLVSFGGIHIFLGAWMAWKPRA